MTTHPHSRLDRTPVNLTRKKRPLGRGSDTARWIALLFALFGSLSYFAYDRLFRPPDAPISGLASVADGDTIRIFNTRIRLLDIDAPELDQTCEDAQGKSWACGEAASTELHKHLRGHIVTCQPHGRDYYQRALATCSLPDGSNINGWLVLQGWAVMANRALVYQTEENEARRAKRGIWRGTFMEPREWRKRHPRQETLDLLK
jgi:endonuclease YncB( thermonuclease family)